MSTRGAKRPRRPPLGELLSEREAEGVRYDERYAPGFTYATVGADSIRPKPRIFDSTWLNGTRLGAKRPRLHLWGSWQHERAD